MATAAAAVKAESTAPAKGAAVNKKTTHLYSVIDTLAREGLRKHDMRDGTKYELSATEKKQMPAQHALTFLNASPTFKVYDPDGNLLERVVASSKGGSATLKPHETIATYAELSREALFARARKYPTGSAFNQSTSKQVLIEFLMNDGKAPASAAKVDDEDFAEVTVSTGDDAEEDTTSTDMVEDDEDDGFGS